MFGQLLLACEIVTFDFFVDVSFFVFAAMQAKKLLMQVATSMIAAALK